MMARIEGPVVVGHSGRGRRELAGVLRRDPDRPGDLQAAHAGRATSPAFRGQELAGGSIDGVARAVPDAGRRRDTTACCIATPYFLPDKAFRARDPPHGAARRRIRRRSFPAATPISAGCGSRAAACTGSCSRPASASSSTRRHDPRQGAARRRPVGGDRHDEPRQPIVRAQRRGERRVPRPRRDGARSPPTSKRTCAQSAKSRSTPGAGGRCGKS